MGDPILGSNEELLEKQGDTKPDPDGEKSKLADLDSKIDDGDVPG